MDRSPTRPLHAIRRVALFALLVALPVIVLSSHLKAVLGPLHLHAPSATAGPSMPHHHDGGERHWHLPQDLSVVFLGSEDDAAADVGSTRVKPSLPLAPPVSFGQAAFNPADRGWPAPATPRWTSASTYPPEQPPKGLAPPIA